MLKSTQKNWYLDLDNISILARYLEEKGDFTIASDVIYFMEKPWKYEKEWEAYQNDKQMNEGLDAFDRR